MVSLKYFSFSELIKLFNLSLKIALLTLLEFSLISFLDLLRSSNQFFSSTTPLSPIFLHSVKFHGISKWSIWPFKFFLTNFISSSPKGAP